MFGKVERFLTHSVDWVRILSKGLIRAQEKVETYFKEDECEIFLIETEFYSWKIIGDNWKIIRTVPTQSSTRLNLLPEFYIPEFYIEQKDKLNNTYVHWSRSTIEETQDLIYPYFGIKK